jgi:hypothetical protein
MEHISLPILKLVEARVVDADTIISPVEQIITPITPVGRGKIEGSPFNLNNISPQDAMMTGFHPANFNHPAFYQIPTTQGFVPSQHVGGFDPNLYPNQFSHPVDQNRVFPNMSPNGVTHIDQVRHFGSMDSAFDNTKLNQPRGYGSIDSSFTPVSDASYGQLPHNGYQQMPQHTMAQNFSGAPAPSDYQTAAMHGINGGSFDFDDINVNPQQQYNQHIPMNRAQGSGSSYGHSPQVQQNPHYPYNHQ